MTHARRRGSGALALLMAAALGSGAAGCATTRLATEWHDAGIAPSGYRVWLVMAAMPDPVRRRLWEDAFAQALIARGVSATPSYRLFPTSFPDTAEARVKLHEGGFDGLLAVRKGAEDEVERRGGAGSVGIGGSFVPFWGVYVDMARRLDHGGPTERERVVRWDVEVWEGRGESRMVWAGRTAMVPPGDAEQASRELAATVMPRLKRARLLP